MKTITFLLAYIFFIQLIYAQSDRVITDNSEIIITPVYHGSVIIRSATEVLYIDPHGNESTYDGIPGPTIVCITHPHGDHFDKKMLARLNLDEAQIIWPQAVAELADDFEHVQSHVLKNGENISIRNVLIEAVPMYNIPDDESARHKKGWGNGYVITFAGKRFYFSGDTEDITEMRNLQDIDYAFVCMNQPYTMTVEQAASAVIDFKPKVVYPYHLRGAGGKMSDAEEFKRLIEESGISTDVKIRSWYP